MLVRLPSLLTFTICLLTFQTEMQAADASLLTKVLRTKLVENVHDVEVQRQDPNSPLYSVKSFEQLPLYVLSTVLHVGLHAKYSS